MKIFVESRKTPGAVLGTWWNSLNKKIDGQELIVRLNELMTKSVGRPVEFEEQIRRIVLSPRIRGNQEAFIDLDGGVLLMRPDVIGDH